MKEKYLEKLEELAQQLKEKATELGPEAWEAALQVIRFNAAQKLVYSFLGIVILSALSYWWWVPKYKEGWQARRDASRIDEEAGVLRMIYSAIGVICTLAIVVIGCLELFDIWNWIAVFEPRLKLAHDIYEKLMAK